MEEKPSRFAFEFERTAKLLERGRAFAVLGQHRKPTARIAALLAAMTAECVKLGGRCRTTGNRGFDRVAYQVVKREYPNRLRLFLPYRKSNGLNSEHCNPTQEAYDMASEVSPYWNECHSGVRRLLANQLHVVLGAKLCSPAVVLFTYTSDGAVLPADVKRTTKDVRVALCWARQRGTFVLNFKRRSTRESLYNWLESRGVAMEDLRGERIPSLEYQRILNERKG